MFELRYIWVDERCLVDEPCPEFGGFMTKPVKVLQYRRQETIITKDGEGIRMSEWMDVPTVETTEVRDEIL